MSNKVEKYKITPEMRLFSKNYKQINRIAKVLGTKLAAKLDQADQLRKALSQIEQQRDSLFKLVPSKSTYELEGQE